VRLEYEVSVSLGSGVRLGAWIKLLGIQWTFEVGYDAFHWIS